MTDSGRQGLGDKAEAKLTPNDSKSTVDKVSDSLSSTADKAQRDLVPDNNKSTGQSLQDKASREKDHHKGGESILDKAKNAVTGDKH